MQNYQQQPPGYQRPGSTASFTGQAPPPPPPYGGANQGYSAANQPANSQWAPSQAPATGQHAQWNQTSQQGSWGQQPQQPQQATGGYNPGTYGAMPGAYQNAPPPPPPKPQGFAGAVQAQAQAQTQTQQLSQNWGQSQGQQSGYAQQQGGYQGQANTQQPYNNAAPPPPSQTPGGSYFPPSQSRPQSIYGADQGRPGSIYGAEQAAGYSNSTPTSAVAQHPPNTVLSPDAQNPAYVPPSLNGQGVTSYMPANTNPMPGVYVPPPPDIPAWQQATHAPLQGGSKKFRYTKPSVDPSFQAQGYQPEQQPQYPPQQVQNQMGQPVYGQPTESQHQHQGQLQAGQFVQPNQPLQQQFGQQIPQHGQVQQQAPHEQIMQQLAQHYQPQENQWQQTTGQQQQQGGPIPAPYIGQQQQHQPIQHQGWHQPQPNQESTMTQQYTQGNDSIQSPKPLGHTDTAPPNFINAVSPETHPVSPVHNRQSISYGSSHNLGRTNSVSSVMASAPNQQGQGSPPKATTPPKEPTKPAASGTAYSALGMGGPSDWEHFADVDEEIDDEELFGAKKEHKNEPAQTHSVELPASQPSPPSTAGEWPTPPSQTAQPAPLNIGIQRRETFQPTPPPKAGTPAQRPPSQLPAQSFVMGDAIVSTQSPQPAQYSQPPPQQQGFVMDSGSWTHPSQSTPAQQQQQPPPHQQAFVRGDGNWPKQAQPKQPTPVQSREHTPAQHQPYIQPPANNTFVMGDAVWGAAEQTPKQTSSTWDTQAPNAQHASEMNAKVAELMRKDEELRAKDDAYERLKSDVDKQMASLHTEIGDIKSSAEKEKSDLRTEVERLKADFETTKANFAKEKAVLNEQIESMKSTAAQAKTNADALAKENGMTIERLKEEGEGKDDIVRERDGTIADLRRQLQDRDATIEDLKSQVQEQNATIEDLTHQLEAEKSKETPKPTPGDLIPDIDPWYAGSLERYIAMLRSEAHEPQVEDKIKAFTSFLAAESAVRGLEYYSAPPAPVAQEPPVAPLREERTSITRETSNASSRRQDTHVSIPQQQPMVEDDSAQYSPGGRPLLHTTSAFKSDESVPTQQGFGMPSGSEPPASAHSTTILTPASSVGDDFNKTPIQSPPEETPQPQYKAYVPPAAAPTSAEPIHRQSLSFASTPSILPLNPKKTGHDEIFFGEPKPATKPESRPTTSTSIISDDAMPAPLSFPTRTPSAPPAAAPAPSPKKDTLENLVALLPKQITASPPHPRLQALLETARAVPTDFTYITTLTTAYDNKATATRKALDAARAKRQEESEARTDQLFNDNEISYADIGAIEDEFKEKERQLKAQEDRDEYRVYVEEVFDKVYDGLQSDVKVLMDAYMEVEGLLDVSVSGVAALENDSGTLPSTKEAIEAMKELHELLEIRHERIVAAVQDRDRRYKKTEIQPLYARGDIAKMKAVERHFEQSEKMAAVRAKTEKAARLSDCVHVVEEVVFRAVAGATRDIDGIVDAIRALDDDVAEGEVLRRKEVLNKANETLCKVKIASKELLALFSEFETRLHKAALEADIAKAKAEGKDAKTVGALEVELEEGEKRLKKELGRKIMVIDQDELEVEELLKRKGIDMVSMPVPSVLGGSGSGTPLSGGAPGEEEERKRRLQAALEEARRRNGDL